MTDDVLRSEILNNFRVTRTPRGLKIDVLDYHAGTLILTEELLRRFGLTLTRPE